MKPAASFLHLDTIQWNPIEPNGIQWNPMESNGIQWNMCYWWPLCQIMTSVFSSYCTSLLIPLLVTQLSVRENERQWVGKGVMNKETETVEREKRESEPSGTHRKKRWNQWPLLNGFDLSSSSAGDLAQTLSLLHLGIPSFFPNWFCLSFSPCLYCFRLHPLSSLSSLCWLLTFLIITII